MGFNVKSFQVSTQDGRNFVLLAPVQYTANDGTVYVMPVGATSDGASTPPEIWFDFPPFGSYWQAAFLHDCAYRNTLQLADGTIANLPKNACDNLLLEAMDSLGTHAFTRDAIYDGVTVAGASSFDSDRAVAAAALDTISKSS